MDCSCNGTGNHVAIEATPGCTLKAVAHIAKCGYCLSSNVTIVHYVNIIPGHESKSFKLECGNCGSMGPRMTTLGESIHSWGMMTKVAIDAEDRGFV